MNNRQIKEQANVLVKSLLKEATNTDITIPNRTYDSYKSELEKVMLKTGAKETCVPKGFVISGSGFKRPNENGSLSISFYIKGKDFPYSEVYYAAKVFANKHNFVLGTSYKNGIEQNRDTYGPSNGYFKPALTAEYVYGLAFYDENSPFNSRYYKELYNPLKKKREKKSN